MANDCLYEMKVRGSKEAIQYVIDCLKADYNYSEEKGATHRHFFRIFDCYDDEPIKEIEEGVYEKYIFGYCAWSVSTCMSEGGYYGDCKKNHPDICMGISLAEVTKDQHCVIEVFSEEEGMCFSEHYIYDNGECVCDDTVEIYTGGYNEKGEPTTDIDWDTYDGEFVVFNDHRLGFEEGFAWTI